ncbi:MAG: ferredoxin [Candidatus Omnitrophica bacterium]|nr:ferredoxin [Candidatus Omnitrophota bacterium]
MPKKYDAIRREALEDTARRMCVAARTAPKTKGEDNLIITMLSSGDKKKVISGMKKIAKRDNRPSCARDAGSIKDADQIVVIAAKKTTLGLNCGFCGYPTCKELSGTKGVCAYISMDLGIALGSAVSLAASEHVDNRLMYSIGRAAMETGVLGSKAAQAIGIPLSATGKNPFFDRK